MISIPNDRDWMDRAPLASPFRVDISFILQDSFPTDTSSSNFNEWPRQALRLPDFPREEREMASFAEVENHIDELVAYYRDAEMAKRPFLDATPLFWLRLRLIAGETQMGFPWWDRLRDMRFLLTWIEEAEDGAGFDDLDQGWRAQAVRRGDELFFRDSDWEREKEHAVFRVPLSLCRASAREAWARSEAIVAHLSRAMGKDHWS